MDLQDDLESSHMTQCYKLCAVIAYKRRNSGALPVHVRSTNLRALVLTYTTLASRLTMSTTLSNNSSNFDLKAHGPVRNRARDSVDMQVEDLTCAETALV